MQNFNTMNMGAAAQMNYQQQHFQTQQPKKEPIKLKLQPKEQGFYSNMWNVANPNNQKTLSGAEAVTFMKKSGLQVDKLKEIWRISAQTDLSSLSRDEFYVSLRLISYMQNGMRCDEEAVRAGAEVALPNFEDEFKSIVGPNKSNPQPMPQQDIAENLPSLDDLDFSEP